MLSQHLNIFKDWKLYLNSIKIHQFTKIQEQTTNKIMLIHKKIINDVSTITQHYTAPQNALN